MSDEDRRRLANYVRSRRHELGWHNIREFAQAAGVSAPTISAVENGKNVRANSLALIENALNWKPGSTDAVLAGGDPLVDEQPAGAPPAAAAEPQFSNAGLRNVVRELARRYEDPDTTQAERIMIEGTLRQLKRIIDEQRAARADVRDEDRSHV